MSYIIRAEIDATDDMPGIFARDWFECGVNDKSERYPSADAALMAARAACTIAKHVAVVHRSGGMQHLAGRADIDVPFCVKSGVSP